MLHRRTPVGRSYTVEATDEREARKAARRMAKREGHPTPDGKVLWVDRMGDITGPTPLSVFEVVIEEEGVISE